MMRFYSVLANTLTASVANTFVWFAVTFWVYLQTQSVIATSIMAGVYSITIAVSGVFLGTLVDRFPKKVVMLGSSLGSLVCFGLAYLLYVMSPADAFLSIDQPVLWVFIILTLFGALAGNLRGIALSTLVTLWVPEEQRDRANGLVGTANGVAFLAASIFSGLAIGYLGVAWVLVLAIAVTTGVAFHLTLLPMASAAVASGQAAADGAAGDWRGAIDLRGTIQAVRQVPGLFGLIFFVFTLQASIALLTVGMFVWLCLIPVVEAAEQTILQRVVPVERQGRVFGFAQSIEQAATPITAFLIGPIAQWFFIPYMTTGAGVDLLGAWFGTGIDRGIALLFTLSGLIGLVITVIAMRTAAYRVLSQAYDSHDNLESFTPAAANLG